MIELHVFTNSTYKNSPNTKIIQKTVRSFTESFGLPQPIVWCDPNPNTGRSAEYIKNLKHLYGKVNITTCLSDGYIKAIKSSNSEYLFMLEHDWQVIEKTDSLYKIIEMMENYKITHLRFNRYENLAIKVESDYIEDVNGEFCKTHYVSNNPHIIHRERWIKEALPHVKIEDRTKSNPSLQVGSLGIEQNLINKNVNAAIYGPYGYKPTIKHLDARKKTHKP